MFRLIKECRPSWVIGENVIGIVKLGLDEVLTDLENEGYATRTFNIPACAVGAPHIRQRIWIVAHADSQSEPDGAFDGNAGQRQLGFGFMADSDSQRTQGQWSNGSEEGWEDSGRQAGLCGRAVLADARRDTEGCDTELHGGTAQRSKGKLQSGDGGDDVADTQRKREGRRGVSRPGKDKSKNGKGSSGQLGGHGEAGPEEWWAVEPSVGRLVNGLPNRVPQLRALGNSIVPQIAEEIGNAIKVAEQWKP